MTVPLRKKGTPAPSPSPSPPRALLPVLKAARPLGVALGVGALAAVAWEVSQPPVPPPCPTSTPSGHTFVDKVTSHAADAYRAIKAKFIKPEPPPMLAGAMAMPLPMPPPSATVSTTDPAPAAHAAIP